MLTALTPLTLVLIVVAFIWWNERQNKKSCGDRIIRDVVIKYDDGTTLRIYEVKPTEHVLSTKSYIVAPDVKHTNFMELQAILKFKDHLEECGMMMDLEQAAELWAQTMAAKWRDDYMEQISEEGIKILDAEDVE